MKSTQSLLAPRLLTLIGFSVAITACASVNYSSPQAESSPARSQPSQLGSIWTTAGGMTLYTFAKDRPGQSACYGDCAIKWPPLTADSSDQPRGEFSVITRKDGSLQWTYRGAPLYRWVKDNKPGDISGHGVKNVWYVARSDDAPVLTFRTAGRNLLTDNRQHTLYTFDKDGPDQSNCYQKCAQLWPPLLAQPGDRASAPYGISQRRDGSSQWTLNGQPLYTWIKDRQPGDSSGDGVKGVWHLAEHP